MKDNDLSASPTPRYWVTSEVVFIKDTETATQKTGWFRSLTTERVTYTPDLRTLSLLWQWSAKMGVRLELICIGEHADQAQSLWGTLNGAANPFSDYLVYMAVSDAFKVLPYRPDLLGIIDTPNRVLMWGGRGLTTENLH